ncbi:MAG TPA: diadenylate cyclase CdaA [Thermodesulfobacteriota bacterium]
MLRDLLTSVRWVDLVDIAVVAFVFYRLMVLIKGTRAVQILTGLAIVFLVFHVAETFRLLTLEWILSNFLSSIILVIIVVFQADIRRALAQVARSPFLFGSGAEGEEPVLDEVVKAAVAMGAERVGGLIAIERRTGLRDYVDVGTTIDATVTKELILTIFWPNSPLHDGAIIIQKGRISAAGCYFPLTTNPNVQRDLGTRHRAALGLTEETDAVVVSVSEETGSVSLVVAGQIQRGLDAGTLKKSLYEIFDPDRMRGGPRGAAPEESAVEVAPR